MIGDEQMYMDEGRRIDERQAFFYLLVRALGALGARGFSAGGRHRVYPR